MATPTPRSAPPRLSGTTLPTDGYDPGRPGLAHVELPSDRGRCGDQDRWGEELSYPGPGFRQSLSDGGAALGCGVLEVGLAAFVVLLHRHTQQSDLWVGVWQGGPEEGEVPATSESRVRLVRSGIGDQTTFAEVVAALGRALGGPEPEAEPAMDRPTAASALFGLRTARGGAGVPPAWRQDAPPEVTLTLDDEGSGLVLRLGYNGHHFRKERMIEWLAQYQLLVEQASKSPSESVLDYSLVTQLGRAMLPDPSRPIEKPRYPLLTDAFVACAEKRPRAVAIRQSGRAWTYSELDQASAALAENLCQRGVSAGDVIAVTGQRSFAIVSSMLGVFRSGGILLTIDPKLPLERQKVMLEQTASKYLVCVGSACDLAASSVEVIPVDAMTGAVGGTTMDGALAARLPILDPGSPAYVFFTSGSTGIPKAVLGRHEGLGHFLDWQRRTFEIQPDDRASQLTALSFDVVLRDMFLALTSGATLCIPAEGDVIDPSKILTWMETEGITVLHVVPSLARLWLSQVPPGVRLPQLRRVFFAGEPLTDVLVDRFREAFGNKAMVTNLYGPTETTLAKCYHRVADPEPGVQPIGRPQPQTQVLILNRRLVLCGLNESGEIAIRTPFRTLGYLNSPEANSRVFIANPFRRDPDDLVYLTGDTGRYRTDGLIEILGRIDNQVKIRGMRVEPGEIEATLGHHPAVREAVVAARDDSTGGKVLAAYLVLKQHPGPSSLARQVAEIREFLRARLAEHMVPAAFVVLDALPLNPNGKVNKKALPAPDRTAFSGCDYAPPRDDLERELVAIWGRLLKLERVGIDDRFFDLGGHSLLAVQLAQAVESELRRPCPLPVVFATGTVRALAAELRASSANGASVGAEEGGTVIALQATGAGPQVFCICGIHLYQQLAARLAPEFRVYGIFLANERRVFGDGGGEPQSVSVEEMATGYVRTVRAQQPHGPYLLAGVSFGGVLAYEVAQQLVRDGEEVALVAILDTMLPSALRRDWGRWMAEKVRRARSQGFGHLVRAVARKLGFGSSSGVEEARAKHDLEPGDAGALKLAAVRDRIYSEATRRYPVRPYGGSALLVRATERSFFDSDVSDPTYGWGSVVGHLDACDIDGDHLSILREPNVAELARQLLPRLRRGAARGGIGS